MSRVWPVVLTRVELRKAVDTRAGRWMLAVVALLSAIGPVLVARFAPAQERTFQSLVEVAVLPWGLLLPVIGILLVTGEYSQRTALTTFALVPRRERVVAAKLAAAVVLCLCSLAVATAIAGAVNAATPLLGRSPGAWSLEPGLGAGLLASTVIGVVMGVAFGLLLQSSPAAIVLYFLLPTVWTVLVEVVPRIEPVTRWLDVNRWSLTLSEGALQGTDWARLGTSTALWVLLPLVLGSVRWVRGEPR